MEFGGEDFPYSQKNFYYQLSPMMVMGDADEGAESSQVNEGKKAQKRSNKNFDDFFEKPKKVKKKSVSSSVARAHPNMDGTSYITSNNDDGPGASHLIKIEVYDLKKLKDIEPSNHWKHADVRVKYYAASGDDEHLQSTRDVIYNITKDIARDCRKYYFDHKNNE